MLTPLVSVNLPSIYGGSKPLPSLMARATPDFSRSLDQLKAKLPSLRWSDLFRSYAMQKQSNQDYVTGKKTAFSPPPGGSFHEAGRAMDIDLSTMEMSLADFWNVLKPLNLVPIVSTPDTKLSESWHFDCRGSHQAVYDYVASGKVQKTYAPYTQAARSAILAIGQHVDDVPDQNIALLQSALIRLGFDPGPIDGLAGSRTSGAVAAAGATMDNADTVIGDMIQARFPNEFLQQVAG
jgi:hypothetical protein